MINTQHIERNLLANRNLARAARAIAMLAGLAATTGAQASAVRFDNPPGVEHFVWFGGTSSEPIGLEIMSDAASQTGAYGGIGQFHQANTLPGGDTVAGGLGGGELQVGGAYGDSLLGVAVGTEIPSGLAWRSSGYIWYPGDPLYLPEGEPTYLGIRFPLEEGGPWHYGWIGVVMNQLEPDGPYGLDAFAWAYETEPGVPIVTPEPGTLAALAFGAAVVGLARRRS